MGGRRAIHAGALALALARPVHGAQSDSVTVYDGRPIRAIEFTTRNVFDPVPPGFLNPLWRLANRVHVRTRTGTVRDQLILRPGQRWSAARAREATRELRTLDFLEPISITPIPVGDSVDVRVVTRDVWTTHPEFVLERSGGQLAGSVAFTERNLFGTGKLISAAYHEDPVGITRSVRYADPGVGGSRLRLGFSGARGTSGASDGVEAVVPFYELDSPWSFGVSALRSSGDVHLFRNNAEVAQLSQHLEEVSVFAGHGRHESGIVTRTTVEVEAIERRLGPTVGAGPLTPLAMIGPEESLRLRRVSVELRLWKPYFIERTGLDRVDRIEDFDLGPSATVRVGVAPRALGSTANEGSFQLRLDAGATTPLGFGILRTRVDGRWRRRAEEVVQQAHGRWIAQAGRRQVLEVGVSGIAGHRTPRNFQVVAGGLNGLRAYPVHAVAGTRLMRWNVEGRRMIFRDLFQFVSLGSAAFVDAARAWGAGAEGSGPFYCAGVGLRIAPPRAALGPVIRMDLAWPISPTRDGRREPVLSVGSAHAF